MTTIDRECRCGRPLREVATMCDTCRDQFDRTLGDVPALVEELDITRTRQRAAGSTGTRTTGPSGLPWHEKASEALAALHGLLVSWTRMCNEEAIGPDSRTLPADTPEATSRWLMRRTDTLARHDAGPDALDEIADAVAEGWRIVFWKRRSRVYLGQCGQVVRDECDEVVDLSCPGDVYADEGAAVGYCEECEQGVTVVIRKAEIDKRLHDRLCTPAEVARYAVYLGLDVPRERVRTKVNYWHRHKLIEQRATADNGDPMFRYGEVRAKLYAEFGRDTA